MFYPIYLLRVWSCLVVMSGCTQAFAQPQNQWKLAETLNTNNGGLPQNSCWDLFFDSKAGFLWISTEGGIVRYNGYEQKIFDLRNVKGMTNTRIGSFITSLDGRTFTYSRPGSAMRIENGDVKAAETRIELFPYGTVSSLDNIPPNVTTGKKSSEPLLPGIAVAWPADIKVVSWLNDRELVAVHKDSCYYIKNSEIANRWKIGFCNEARLIQAGDEMYIVKDAREWYRLDLKKQFLTQLKVASVLQTPGARVFYHFGRNNNIPFTLIGDRLYKISWSRTGVMATYFARLPELPSTISSVIVNQNNNDIFIGSPYSGLYIYKYSGFYTYRTDKDLIRPDFPGNSPNNIYGSVLIDTNHVYTSTNLLFDLVNRTYINQPGYAQRNGLLMHYLGNGNIVSPKLPVYNIKTQKNTSLPRLSSAMSFLRINDTIHWTAGTDISIYNGRSLRVVFSWKQLPELVRNTFRTENLQYLNIVGETADHRLMVHDGFHYVLVDTLAQKAVVKFTMPKEASRVALMDSGRYCWIPTYGDGIYLYDLQTDSLYQAPVDINGYLRYAHTLAPDGHGNFLVPTNYGLFRMNRKHLIDACKSGSKNLLYDYYDTKTGLVNIEFNGNCVPAYNIMTNGDVLLPSFGGLVRVFTSALPEKFSYPIFVDAVKTASNVYTNTRDLVLAADERTMSVTLNYAQWHSRYSPSISYRMDDEQAWTYLPPGEQTIQLIELAGGKHLLHVKNQSDLPGEKYVELNVPFTIGKKYYEKLLFWILSGLSLVVFVGLMIVLGNKRLKKKNIALEEKVREKTIVVTNQNAELEHTLQGLNELIEQMELNSHFQKKLMSIIGHDFMVPLQYMAKVSGSLQAYKKELSEKTRDESISEISTTSTSLVYLGQGIIQWIKLQETDFRLEADYFKLADTIKEIEPLHRQLSQQKSNTLNIVVDEILVLLYDTVAIKIMLHNLLINANKFTSKGIITLHGYADDDQLVLKVSDTGMGMSPEVAARLNNMQAVMSTHGTGNESGWGLGYRLIIDLLKASQGTLSIRSEKMKGTVVTITIPDII
ncbi:MAG: HAMP domain-containing sensor histidine kinase [Bacteroidota bacterium]